MVNGSLTGTPLRASEPMSNTSKIEKPVTEGPMTDKPVAEEPMAREAMADDTPFRHQRGGIYFDDFVIGRLYRHRLTRTVTFTLGLMIGISVNDLTVGTTVANLGMTEVKFPHPLFEGDTVHCSTTIVAKRESKSRPGMGIVEFDHRAYNQDDRLVAQCRRQALMRMRPR
jgi:acyl dehydratase